MMSRAISTIDPASPPMNNRQSVLTTWLERLGRPLEGDKQPLDPAGAHASLHLHRGDRLQLPALACLLIEQAFKLPAGHLSADQLFAQLDDFVCVHPSPLSGNGRTHTFPSGDSARFRRDLARALACDPIRWTSSNGPATNEESGVDGPETRARMHGWTSDKSSSPAQAPRSS